MNQMTGDCCVFDGQLLTTVLPPLLLLECVLGILGNGLALWIFCFHVKPWKSSTVFLFNLALTDFLLNVVLPFRAIYYLRGKDWDFGDTFCRISLFMLAMNRSGSIFFLMAVAMDRYLRVVHPHHSVNFMSVSRAMFTACILWALTISLTANLLSKPHHSLPQILERNFTHCDSFVTCPTSNADPVWHRFVFIFTFYLPLAVILFCSFHIIMQLRKRQLHRNNKIQRALRLIVLVVVMFVVCFLPSNINLLLIWARRDQTCEPYKTLDTALYITISLTYLNSMLDPIIYYFSSPVFKKTYRKMVRLSLRRREEPETAVDQTRDIGSQSCSQL